MSTVTTNGARKPRILILGGGFAGTYTALELRRRLGSTRAEIAVVNRDNFFVFYPLLPEILSGEIDTEHVLTPIRLLVPDISLYVGEVNEIDLERRRVTIRHGLFHDRQGLRTLEYDYLVLALGGVPNTHGIPGLAEHSFDVMRLSHAFGLRNHLIDVLEQADIETDPDARRRLLTVVVAGGGTNGVEIAAQVRDLMMRASRRYHTLSSTEMRLVLVHSGERLIPELPASLARYTAKLLTRRGVEIRLGRRVTSVEPNRVHLDDGAMIEARTIISSIGIQPNPLLHTLTVPHDRQGRIEADEFLRIPSHPEVWVVGDNARAIDPHNREPYPQTAQHAIREARLVGRNIAAHLEGKRLNRMRYRTRGQMVDLGHRTAAVDLNLPGRSLDFAGPIAWFLWRSYYLLQLPRWEKRLRVTFDWTLDLLFPPSLVQLKVEVPMRPNEHVTPVSSDERHLVEATAAEMSSVASAHAGSDWS